ncbi:MAG TPA: branched-chain amino acid ABC transporter permease [Methanosphaera sp.]|nr:branched-chain amino acid ABC transporter permease [Methanosphaera sp.]HIJ15279.1 branched-chain amino acid ABC transporter permease [Methanosphaera sp.]
MGIGYAALAIKAGLTPLQTVGFSVLVYAGAGEIIAVTMLLNGATALAIILTNFVVNLRYFVMNVCVYNKVEKSSLLVNALSSHLTTDESFAMFSLMDESSIWTYIGLSLTSWLSWILGAAIGVFVLDLLPVIVTNSFNISLYALFVAILVPNIKKNYRIGLLVIITGIINIILQTVIGNWSIIVSTLLGALIGVYIINDGYFLTDDGGIK